MDSTIYYSDGDVIEESNGLGAPYHSSKSDSLASHANSLLPISRLPGETLALIFQHSSNVRRYHGDLCEVHVVRKEIVSISHVCHEWRSIALDYSSFWSCIDFCSWEWANEMVSRARDAPLCIELDLVPIWSETQPMAYKRSLNYFCPYVLPSLDDRILDISHIDKIFIEAMDPLGQLTTLLLGFFGKPNAIRCLSIQQVQQQIEDILIPINRNIIPRRFFHAPTPNLRHLDLGNCAVSWHLVDAKPFSELRTLALDRESCPQSMEDLCRLLSEMVKLEEFRLILESSANLTPIEFKGESSILVQPVMLPSLMVYHLTAQVQEATPIVTHVLYPSCAFTRLWLSGEPHHSILNHRSLVEKLSARKPSSLRIKSGFFYDRYSICIWDSPTAHPARPASSQPHTEIEISGGVELPHQLSPVVLKTLAIPDLQSLTIDHLGPVKEELWHDFFSRHVDVLHLQIISHNIQPFISLLSSPDHAATTLPKLQTLSLGSEGVATDESSGPHGLNSYEDFSALLRCLTCRFHRGVPVETLVVSLGGGYDLAPEDIEELGRVGTNVVHPV